MASHAEKKFYIEFFAIPHSEAFFSLLRFTGIHPITWRENCFVPSGHIFSVVVFLALCFHVTWLSDDFLDNFSMVSRFKGDSNPIRKDIDFFLSSLNVASILLEASFMIVLQRKRKSIASTFNDLNSLWYL